MRGGGGGGPWLLIVILAFLQEMFGGRERREIEFRADATSKRASRERPQVGEGILVSRFTEEEIIHVFAFRTTVTQTLSNGYLLHRDGRVFGIRTPTLCLSSCTAETPLSLASTLRSPIQPANQLRPSTHEDDCAKRHLPRDRTIPLLHLLYILSRFLT